MFGFKERTTGSPVDRRRALDGVPLLNPAVRLETAPGGQLLLIVPRPRHRGWLARFQPAVMERRVKLDELGSFVVRQIDGRRPVREIVDAFEREYRLNRREAELSCVEFMRSLMRRGVLAVAIA